VSVPDGTVPVEMTAVAWAAIALLGATLAVLVGALFQLGARIEGLGRDLGARIDAQGRDLGARIDALTARIDAQTARIDAHLERHAG
jgi:hypothetical protein